MSRGFWTRSRITDLRDGSLILIIPGALALLAGLWAWGGGHGPDVDAGTTLTVAGLVALILGLLLLGFAIRTARQLALSRGLPRRPGDWKWAELWGVRPGSWNWAEVLGFVLAVVGSEATANILVNEWIHSPGAAYNDWNVVGPVMLAVAVTGWAILIYGVERAKRNPPHIEPEPGQYL
jgi:hypothetical protein